MIDIENGSPLLLIGTLFLALAVIPAFGILYEVSRTEWNAGPLRGLGRVLLSKSVIIASVLTFSLIGGSLVIFGWGRPLWFEVLRLALFGAFVPVLYAQWIVYRRIRITGQVPETLTDTRH